MEKFCKYCSTDRPIEYFYQRSLKCRICKLKYQREYRRANPERQKGYKDRKRESINIQQRDYRNRNKDKTRGYTQKYYPKLLERLRNDTKFKLAVTLRSRVKASLKFNGATKRNKTRDLIGCDILFLKKYIEDRFLPTMTWKNQGRYWQIDHIIPCCYFNLDDVEEQKRCFHYSNLQPLFAITQIINGVKYIGNFNKNNQLFMFETITIDKFKEILNKGYSLDMVLILCYFKEGIPAEELTSYAKMNAIIMSLIRKGLLTEDYKVTVDGDTLIKYINTVSEVGTKLIKLKVHDEFEEFWKAFPSTDTFIYKGVSFQGSRALRINKEDCKLKLKAILNEGEYSIDIIIAAIEFDVLQKKEASLRTKTNKLTYIQNSLTYLRQRSFEPFIELLNTGVKIEETKSMGGGGTDI